MTKTLILIGSPRKAGNTRMMADALNPDASEMVFLYDLKIGPCVDCRACKSGDGVCVLKDDMAALYEKIDNADTLIIGTPIYWFGPTAVTKLVLDRFRPYFGNRKLEGKAGALLLPAGVGAGDCDLTIDMFRRAFKALGAINLGAVTARAYDAGDVKGDAEVMQQLHTLSKKIVERTSS